ncbi:MAG: hypothetical protein NTX40_00015 [Planctomycetota bacterium]|nr:hypothetical protein [Planctomycetota bacterium]
MRALMLLLIAGMVVAGVGFRAVVATGEEAVPEALPQGSAAAAAADLEASAVRALGVVEGKPIDTGFVFVDGCYVEAPYTVSRRGRQISINGILIYQWAEWPLMDRHVREDPGPPPKEYENMKSFNDVLASDSMAEWLNCHLERKRRYLYEHFPEEEAKKKMLEYYRQCPFVASVNVPAEGPVEIVTKSGKKENMTTTPPLPHMPGHWDFGAQDVLRGLEDWRNLLTRFLSENETRFFFGVPFQAYGTEISPRGYYPTSWQRPGDLKLMVEILTSARSEAEKIELLGRLEFLPSPNAGKFLHPVFAALAAETKGHYETLIRNFRPSAQLAERIAEMVKKSGVTPRTIKELPDEIPWDRAERLDKEKREREKQEKEEQEKGQGAVEKN